MQTVTVFNADNITLYDMNVYIAVDSKLLPDKISPPPNAGEPLMFLSFCHWEYYTVFREQ
jgi:hypothetical protein